MKLGSALGMFVLLTIAYISVLLYADLRGQVFHHIADIGLLVAVICAISTCSFLLRFLRWRWLLARRGFETPLVSGCLSYFAGFALTTLPGKLGELVRMRYFSLLGVPGNVVVGCFFFERLIDIGAVLLLVCLIAHAAPGFWVGSAFAATLILVVVLIMCMSRTWSWTAAALSRRGFQTVARFVEGLGSAFSLTRSYFNRVETPIAFLFGLIAFGQQALGFVYIAARLGFECGWLDSIAIFPLATLLGAASMVPGGIGTTEVATVVIMRHFGASLEVALVAAVVMRLGTLWYAIALGIVAAGILEIRHTSAAQAREPLKHPN